MGIKIYNKQNMSDEIRNTMENENSDQAGEQDLTQFVQQLLGQMQTRFQQMSDQIIGRIDEMGTRIDDLENSIGELLKEANDDELDALQGGNSPKAGDLDQDDK